jgi:chromosome segregation ATPase
MTPEQISKLIEVENEERAAATMREARRLIQRISQLQESKIRTDAEIAECREELKKLSSTTVSPLDVIGGF